MAMQRDMRLFLGSLAFAVALSAFGLAYPNMSRLITVPLAIIALCFAMYFLLPELRGIKLGAHKKKLSIAALACTTLIVGFAGYSAWHFELKPILIAPKNAGSTTSLSKSDEAADPSHAVKMPSLLSLYMYDFSKIGSDGLVVRVDYDINVEFHDKTKYRFYCRIIGDTGNNSKFLALYFPYSDDEADAVAYFASVYKNYLNGIPKFNSGSAGDLSVEMSQNLVFTGKIVIYYENPLSIIQLGQLASVYESQGAIPDFRGHDYALSVSQEIQNGHAMQIPEYEIINGDPKSALSSANQSSW